MRKYCIAVAVFFFAFICVGCQRRDEKEVTPFIKVLNEKAANAYSEAVDNEYEDDAINKQNNIDEKKTSTSYGDTILVDGFVEIENFENTETYAIDPTYIEIKYTCDDFEFFNQELTAKDVDEFVRNAVNLYVDDEFEFVFETADGNYKYHYCINEIIKKDI